ncbi:hypothetical protein ACX40Y_09540 [Sphingomonas sp. RS6]
MTLSLPCSDLADRLRRAARNGTRLHLDVQHIRVLMSEPIYSAISMAELKELNAQCQQDDAPPTAAATPVINSAPSGCGIAQTATIGTSAGIKAEMQQAADVGHAASRLASEAALQISRRKKRATR